MSLKYRLSRLVLELFFALFLIFYNSLLWQKLFLHPLDLAIQVVLGNITYLPFGTLLILLPLDDGNFYKIYIKICSNESVSNASISY